ncbi:hypothetical protein M8C21_001323, partial [Ambrosia artemisiifolia]
NKIEYSEKLERERSRDERQIRGDDRLAAVCAQLIGPHLSYTTRQAFLPFLYSPDDYRMTESVQAPHPYHYMYQHLSSGINYDFFCLGTNGFYTLCKTNVGNTVAQRRRQNADVRSIDMVILGGRPSILLFQHQ